MPVLDKIDAVETANAAAAAEAAAEKRKKFRGRLPDKRTINLATVNEKPINWLLAVPLMLLVVALAGVFLKFLVLDRFDALYKAQGEAASVRRQVEDGYKRVEEYGELNDLYAHYTYSGMTEEELGRVDRVAVMELLERVVIPRTPVDAWSLSGNTLTLNIDGSTLQEINLTVQALLAEDLVDYCTVTTASTGNQNARSGQTQEGDAVTAHIVVYLSNAEEANGK